jgi:L-lactate dehydrogenase (cytochrome)
MNAASVLDYRTMARRRVPRFLFEYLDGGSFAERTKAANTRDLDAIHLRQRVLCDVSSVDTATTLFGQAMSMPVALAPVGLAGMFARRGEVQALKAAESAGVPFTLSTVGVCSLAEVDAAASTPFWFQLYMIRDRGFMRELLAQAREAQVSTLVFTVDMPLPGTRYRDYRSGLAGETRTVGNLKRVSQALLCPRWAWDVGLFGRPHHLGNIAPVLGTNSGLEDFMAWMKNNFDASVTWGDLEFVREHWPGSVVLKGILDSDDAKQAADLQLDGIVVSNHGGRQLDGVTSTACALPRIAEAVGDRLTVLADGGIYSGLDVLRMLALGARGVLLGRAWVYALAGRGGAGVSHVLELVRNELRVAMALTGCKSVSEIDRHVLSD